MKKVIASAFVIVVGPLFAQTYLDIAKLYYNTSASNNFKNSNQQTSITEMGFDFTYPIALQNKNAFLTGFSFDRTQVKLYEAAGYESISAITLRIGLNKQLTEKWSGTYMVIPKLASDFQQSAVQNFQIGALALLKYTKNQQINYKVGLFLNSDRFGPFISPLLGFYYLGPSKKFEANVTLPSSIDLNYELHPAYQVGLNFTGQIKSYRLSKMGATANPGYVVKSSNEICGYLKLNFTKTLSLQTRIGYSIARSYKVFDESDKIDLAISFIKLGNNRHQLNTNFLNGAVYQAILLYRFVRE